MTRAQRSSLPALLVIALLVAAGCATQKKVKTMVDEGVEPVYVRVEQVEGQVEANQTRLDEHAKQISGASATAQEALERAKAAGKLAEGKFLYQTVLSDDKVHFGFDEAALSDEAHAALDAFAVQIKQENQNVYVEIQGYTDSIGSEDYNLELGEKRAEAVRRYLSAQGFPLHRMSVISYGESNPVADNGSREGRAQNRRVVLVVLK